MRLAIYGCVSSILAIGVVLSAMHQRSNFYAACIYLSKSSACMMILLNMGLIISVLFGKALQAIFFGRLRAIEIEHLYERSWYAVTETCLAMTIFREEFDLHFIVVFTTLLFLKIFHWLCQDRVDYMEQSPTSRVTFHVRIVNLLVLLFLIDTLLARHAIQTLVKGPNMMIMFGFEYTILICTIVSIIGKYILNVIDMQSEQTWEGKSMYVFYLDLVTDFFKLVTYLIFFLYICLNYQLPLHIIRDVYVTFRSFVQKCRDLYRYRRATRNMNELYPNATAEDFSRSSDSTCIICREEMHVVDATLEEENPEVAAYGREGTDQNLDQPKKLPCGHIFHFHCLRSWLERQQTCPTCRRSVLVEANANAPTLDAGAAAAAAAAAAAQQQQQQQQAQQLGQSQSDQPPPPPSLQYQQPQHNHMFGGFQPQNTYPTHSTSNPSFNILTPSNEPSAIPGLIPLVPLNQALNPSLSSQEPNSLPLNLSEADLTVLSNVTREAMEQRLKILETVQNQIFQSMQTLTQVLSVLPVTQSATETQQQQQEQEQQHNEEESGKAEASTEAAPAPSKETSTTLIELSENEEEESQMSSRRKEKLPDRHALFEDTTTL